MHSGRGHEIRHAQNELGLVIARKLSFGTESAAGSRFVERMLTVTTTLEQQDRNVLDYLVAGHEARLLGRPAPSILPCTT
jgi:transposase